MTNVVQLPGIDHGFFNQTWPSNRAKGDFRKILREQAERELRVTVCGFCGTESPKLDGPTGRAWFKSHRCPRAAA